MTKIYRTCLPVEIDPEQHMIEVEYKVCEGSQPSRDEPLCYGYSEINCITREDGKEIEYDDLPLWYQIDLENECSGYAEEELAAMAEYMEEYHAGDR